MKREELKKHIENVDSVMYEKGVWSDKLHSWNQIKMLLEQSLSKCEFLHKNNLELLKDIRELKLMQSESIESCKEIENTMGEIIQSLKEKD